jgi:hypothetical protein
MSRENVEVVRKLYASGEEILSLLKAERDISDHPWLELWDPVWGRSQAGAETTLGPFHAFRLRYGRVLRVTGYLNRDQALEAVGLRE